MRVRRGNNMRLGITLLAISAVACVGQAPATMPLSLKKAVEIALTPDGSTRVALAEEALTEAQRQQQQARATFLPSLDGSVNDRRQTNNLKAYGFSFSLPIPGFSIPTIVGPFSVFDARLTAQQSVFNFSDIHKYRAAKISALAVKTDAASTRNSVSDEVARDYLAGLLADANRGKAQANVDLSEALLKLARQEKDAGTGTGTEVTRAELQQ